MNRSLPLKIIFYTVLLAAAVALGLLIQKNINKAPATTSQPATNEAAATNTEAAIPPPEQKPGAGQTNNQQPTASNPSCIITIDGQKYDVQPLRSIHPGGDIYICDTDMSAIFHGKHGESVKRIEKYLVP